MFGTMVEASQTRVFSKQQMLASHYQAKRPCERVFFSKQTNVSFYQVKRPCERAAMAKRNGTKHSIKMI